MFFYLYDSFVLDKKNEPILRQIEGRIIELGINGRIERLTPLRNLKEIIDAGLKQQAHTFIVVGTDATWLRVMNILADQPVTLGLIPLSPTPSVLATLFGIGQTVEACNILSRRMTKPISVIKANQNHILTELTAELPAGATLRCDDSFRLIMQQPSRLHVMNLGKIIGYKETDQKLLPPHQDIAIDIEPQPVLTRRVWPWGGNASTPGQMTHLATRKITIDHPEQSITALIDGTINLKCPITVTFKPKALKVIVGKQRRLA